jgi:hypothetical protein
VAFVQNEDCVEVIRHHHRRIDRDIRESVRDSMQQVRHHSARVVENGIFAVDSTEQARAAFRADRDEVRARLRIVVVGEPQRSAVVAAGIVGHRWGS